MRFGVVALLDLGKQRWDAVFVERQAAHQHDVKDDAAAPYIDLGPRGFHQRGKSQWDVHQNELADDF